MKSGPPLPTGWQPKFLAHYKQHGGVYRSAEAVGVSHDTVRRYRQVDPAFDQEIRDAKEYFADICEEDMLASAKETGNPVPWIVRLKALRPSEYIEKHAIMSVNITGQLDPGEAALILREMLGDLSAPTLAALQPAPMLPEATP